MEQKILKHARPGVPKFLILQTDGAQTQTSGYVNPKLVMNRLVQKSECFKFFGECLDWGKLEKNYNL